MKFVRSFLIFVLILCLCMPALAENGARAKLELALSAKTLEEQADLIAQAAVLSQGDPKTLLSCAQLLAMLDSSMEKAELYEKILAEAYKASEGTEYFDTALDMLVSFYAYKGRYAEAYGLLEKAALSAADPSAYYNLAATLRLYDGDMDGAQALLDKVLSLDPSNHTALTTKAALLAAKYDYEGALTAFDQVLSASPDSTDALYGKYTTLVSSGNFKKASRILDQLISLTGEDSLWLERASLTLWQRYLPENALKEAEALLKMDESWLEAVTIKVGSLLMLKRYDEAIEACAAYDAISAEHGEMMRALTYMDSSRYDEAIAKLDGLLSGENAQSVHYTYRGVAEYYAHDDALSALSYLADAAALGASEYTFYLNLGHFQRRVGQYEQAARAYAAAANLTMDDPTAEYYSVLIYAEAGKTEEMLSALDSLEMHYPGWYETMMMRVIVEDLLGHAEAALEAFLALEEKFPFPAETLWSMKGVLLASAGKGEEALEILTAQHEEVNASDLSNHALALLHLGDSQAALSMLEEARSILGTDASAATRIDRVNLETACAYIKLHTGDAAGCTTHLEEAAQFGWQPAQLLHWFGFEEYVQTSSFASLMETYDTASSPWDVNGDVEMPQKTEGI